jgi:hypothetical protein
MRGARIAANIAKLPDFIRPQCKSRVAIAAQHYAAKHGRRKWPDLLEWRQRLESTHKQLLDAMTERGRRGLGFLTLDKIKNHMGGGDDAMHFDYSVLGVLIAALWGH